MPHGEIQVTSTIPDLGNLGGLLLDVERRVLTRARAKVLSFVKSGWTGWKYKGRPLDKRNISFKAWKGAVIVAGGRPELRITNDARSWDTGKPYVAHVARSRGAEPEWEIVARELAVRFTPVIQADLLAEVTRNLNTPRRPARVRAVRADTLVVATGMEL